MKYRIKEFKHLKESFYYIEELKTLLWFSWWSKCQEDLEYVCWKDIKYAKDKIKELEYGTKEIIH